MPESRVAGFGWFSRRRPEVKWAVATALVMIGSVIVSVGYSIVARQRPAVAVTFDKTTDRATFLTASNASPAARSIRLVTFTVSTARFGKIGYEKFDLGFPDNDTVVAAGETMSLQVATPASAQPFLCAELRSIGFFRDYGSMSNGKLIGQAPADRPQQIAADLQCSFAITEASATGQPATPYALRTDCNKIGWIQDCIASVL